MKRILYGIIAGHISFMLLGVARLVGFEITEKLGILASCIFAAGAMAGGAPYD